MSRPRNPKRERIENIIGGFLAALFVAVIVVAQRSVGWPQLCLMLLALFGLIGLLALYNRRFQ